MKLSEWVNMFFYNDAFTVNIGDIYVVGFRNKDSHEKLFMNLMHVEDAVSFYGDSIVSHVGKRHENGYTTLSVHIYRENSNEACSL